LNGDLTLHRPFDSSSVGPVEKLLPIGRLPRLNIVENILIEVERTCLKLRNLAQSSLAYSQVDIAPRSFVLCEALIQNQWWIFVSLVQVASWRDEERGR